MGSQWLLREEIAYYVGHFVIRVDSLVLYFQLFWAYYSLRYLLYLGVAFSIATFIFSG